MAAVFVYHTRLFGGFVGLKFEGHCDFSRLRAARTFFKTARAHFA